MASFDSNSFDALGFDPAAFDLEQAPAGALYGSAAGSGGATATLSAVAWIAGSSAGSSTGQAYLELDGGVPSAPTTGGSHWARPTFIYRPKEDDEALLLLGIF